MVPDTVGRESVTRTLTAPQKTCPHHPGQGLWIAQHRERVIHHMDETVEFCLRDKKCPHPCCPDASIRYRPVEEGLLALPGASFGLDVMLAIGSMRLQDSFSFPRIHARLQDEGVPITLSSVQRYFQKYLALVSCQVGRTDGQLRERLRQQGGIIPVIDGVQFGEGEPVLYLIVDALSRQPLFGQEMVSRGKDDLVPFIAQLHELEVPILSVVSDKERALEPAIAEALPGVKHQLCQLHYVANAAKPMDDDLKALGAEIRDTAGDLRDLQRDLQRQQKKAEQADTASPPDLGVALELCEAAQAEARRYGRAPFDPPALKRHEGIERVAQATDKAARKKKGRGPTSRNCVAS